MRKKIKLIASYLLLLSLISPTLTAKGEVLIFANDTKEVLPQTTIFNYNDTSGNVVLQFGNTLNERLYWEDSGTQFIFTDDLKVQGNLSLDGNNFIFDDDNLGAGQNVNITANQGIDPDGILRYNATTNKWEISNDGGTFYAITSSNDVSSTPLPGVQVRQAGAYTLSSAVFADITFDTTDVESKPATLEHNNTNTDNIDIKETGLYLISYNLNVNQGTANITFQTRVRKNDTTVLNGSVNQNSNYQNEHTQTAVTFLAELTAGDFITLQAQRTTANNMTKTADPLMTIVKLDGIKGDKGDQGVPGSAGLGTNSENFTIDLDDTGGNLNLVFGSTLNEYLRWDNTNSEFDLSDNLDINVSGKNLEVGDGTANDHFITFDDGTPRNLGWDDSETAFSTFDNTIDLRVIQSATPPATCSASIAGKIWMDTDTGMLFICDSSNSRNKWLSLNDNHIWGENTGTCNSAADIGSSASCAVQWGAALGPDTATDLGFYIPHPLTITGYGFSQDNDACTSGSFDLEVWSSNSPSDDNTFTFLTNIVTGLNNQAHNASNLNIDIAGDQYINWGIDNNCGQNIDDWNLVIYYKYRST